MRIYDVLYSMNTGNASPKARPFDNLLGQALGGEVEKTTTGNPVSIVTSSAQNAISTLLSFSPKQTGTGDPSPINIRPIVPWSEAKLFVCGSNLLSPSYFKQAIIDSCDNRIIVDGNLVTLPNGGGNANTSVTDRVNIFEGKFVENTVYTIIIGAADTPRVHSLFTVVYTDGTYQSIYSSAYDSDNMCWRYVTTAGKSVDFIRINRDHGSSITYDTSKSGIFVGDVLADDFEPYTQGTDLTISLGGTYYGFSVDIERGVLTVDRVMVDLGSLNWGYGTWGGHAQFNVTLVDSVTNPAGGISGMISSSYTEVTPNNFYVNGADGTMTLNGNVVRIANNSYSDTETFKAAMNGVQLVYPLATPLEIPLTPHTVALLAGNNTLWTDGDEISITYKAKRG